jgi:2-methylcitrate synthase
VASQSSSFTEGLEGIVAAQSSICTVDGQAGRLIYYGYDIQDLAANSTFEEVTYLLWFGDLPTRPQLEKFTAELAADRTLPDKAVDLLRSIPSGANSMDLLRTMVSALGLFDPEANDPSREANVRKALRLQGQIATLVAALQRIQQGKDLVPSDPKLSHAADFLYMLTGETPRAETAHIFDVALILHADHELNASTFAARVTAATLSDFYSAITSAVGTLKGPLHGGANEAVMKMLLKIGGPDDVEPYISAELNAKRRIPGFGHRVYRTWDPRALVLQELVCEFERSLKGDTNWCQLAQRVAETVFAAKRLYPNVDFYSAPLYYTLGIPIELYTPVFAVSRISGWAAHVLEQYAHNRLIRPRAEYTGPENAKYMPIDQRDPTGMPQGL